MQIYELPAAPKLSVEQAQFLNEAYAQEDPLQDLLRMHRTAGTATGSVAVADRRHAEAGCPGCE